MPSPAFTAPLAPLAASHRREAAHFSTPARPRVARAKLCSRSELSTTATTSILHPGALPFPNARSDESAALKCLNFQFLHVGAEIPRAAAPSGDEFAWSGHCGASLFSGTGAHADFNASLRRAIDAHALGLVVVPGASFEVVGNVTAERRICSGALWAGAGFARCECRSTASRVACGGAVVAEAEGALPALVAEMDGVFRRGCAGERVATGALFGSLVVGGDRVCLDAGVGGRVEAPSAFSFVKKGRGDGVGGGVKPGLTRGGGGLDGVFGERGAGKKKEAVLAKTGSGSGAATAEGLEAPVEETKGVAAAAAAAEKDKKGSRSGAVVSKVRPRLTVSSEMMERLRQMSEIRGMTPSQIADEIIADYLGHVSEEEGEDGEGERGVGEGRENGEGVGGDGGGEEDGREDGGDVSE